jgi:3-hexulose-6-phosphate synthase
VPAPALQLALDGTLDAATRLLDAVADRIDRIEIGTPLIVREGMRAVRTVRERVPRLPIVADLKIMDAGEEEAEIAFAAGADEVTVLAVADDDTVRGAVAAAQAHGGRVVADLIQAPDPSGRGARLLALGIDLLAVHAGTDVQRRDQRPFDGLRSLREALPEAPLAVAGGIDATSAARVVPWAPAVVIVGGAIANADDPRAVATAIREALR